MRDFTPSTVPGCRAPHLWLDEKASLYDVLGQGYTLIRLDPALQPSSLIHAAASRGVPLTILDVNEANARPLYACKLVLVRPDQHVAWRGDELPPDPLRLIDLIRGACDMPPSKTAQADVG